MGLFRQPKENFSCSPKIVTASLSVLCLLLCFNCGSGGQNEREGKMNENNSAGKIRYPVVAGQFYTANPTALREEVEKYIDDAEAFPEFEPIALIAPHAGYVYSGWIAGYSFRQVQGKEYDAVVVISPYHGVQFGFSAVLTEGSYQTPLGRIPIDRDLALELCAQSELVVDSEQGHFSRRIGSGEHSLEVELPFLQVALGEFKLVPIVMGDQSWENCKALGETLGKILTGKKALIVASTDLSHFHSYGEANKLDSALIESLELYQPEETCRQLMMRKVEACGGGPVVAAMFAGKMLGAEGLKALKHANSGDVPMGSKDSVVGYLAAVIYKKAGEGEKKMKSEESSEQIPDEESLTLEEKRQLMEIARASVECAVRGEPIPDFVPVSETLEQDRGAFVTLTIDGRLRGCIGYIVPVKPLYLTVEEVAQSAALRDPRFPPVSIGELPLLEYEISALSPVRIIQDVGEIEVGKHGLIIRRGFNQGLLLPQVASGYGWNVKQFLEQTCRKAGLPIDAWKKEGTEISVFSAEVFEEGEMKLEK